MTEEEFRALLKISRDDVELELVPKVIWHAQIVSQKTPEFPMWACSEDKEMALEQLAEKFFKDLECKS